MDTTDKKSSNTRRTFLAWLLGIGIIGWITGIAVAIIQYLKPPKIKRKTEKTISLGPKANITNHKKYKKDSDSLVFSYRGKPAILVKTDTGNFRAFDAECTHLACIVEWKKNKKIFFCNCHGGSYSENGKNIGGPPPTPLKEFTVVEKNGELFIQERQG